MQPAVGHALSSAVVWRRGTVVSHVPLPRRANLSWSRPRAPHGSFRLKHVAVESAAGAPALAPRLSLVRPAPELVWVRASDHSLARLACKLSPTSAFQGIANRSRSSASTRPDIVVFCRSASSRSRCITASAISIIGFILTTF